ncbi:ORF1 [Tomato chocolate virus]|nr:ORF1 [Tomato chocolate virus]
MSFISRLNISEEEKAFHSQVSTADWVCSVDVGTGLINSNPTLDFKVTPKTGGSVSILSVSWENSYPQLVPGHYLLRSGNWPVSNVKLSGLLVHRSVKLETTRKLLEAQKVQILNQVQAETSTSTSTKGKGVVDILKSQEEEISKLKEELLRKEKELSERDSEIAKLKLQVSNLPGNNDIFSGWAETPPQ